MRADHLVCGAGWRQREKFGDEVAPEPDGMAALRPEARDANQREWRFEQGIDGLGGNGRMIHQREEDAIGIGRYGAQPGL